MWLSSWNIIVVPGIVLISALFCASSLSQDPNQTAPSSILNILQRHDDLSQIYTFIRDAPGLNTSVDLTLFAPTNDAIRKYGGKFLRNETLLYQFTSGAKLTSQMEEGPIYSPFLDKRCPIWITIRSNSSRIFVNDAEIQRRLRNFQITNSLGVTQTVHVIDRVLEPTLCGAAAAAASINGGNEDCPNAKEFLTGNSSSYSFGWKWENIAGRVSVLQKDKLFEASGGHTFFIPVDKGFQGMEIEKVDHAIIEGHVIPNQVLFLRPTLQLQKPKTQYKTASDSESPILIEVKQNDGDENGVIVQSDWRSSTNKFHVPGIVQVEVVKGNIPVRNGVVHLISKPLAITQLKVLETLKMGKEGGSMQYFYKLMYDYYFQILTYLQTSGTSKGVTIFVPTKATLQQNPDLINDLESGLLEQCLRRHIIMDVVWSANMTQEHAQNGLDTMDPNTQMWFTHDEVTDKFTVNNCDGTANITQPDIGATNGVIHMIDAVLCGHFTCATVIDAISKFDDLSEFYNLVKSTTLVKALKREHDFNWTLLVPTNDAIQKYRAQVGVISEVTLLYHFFHGVKTTSDFELNVDLALDSGDRVQPPIWIRNEDINIFANNAKVDAQRRNLMFRNSSEMTPIFHVIDQVLEPLINRLEDPTESDLNPDAFTFMSNFKFYNIESMNHTHTINHWVERVSVLKSMDIFQWSGGHTFFIPVDKAFDTIPISIVSNAFIESHVVLNQVLFLRPSSMNIIPSPNRTLHKTATSSVLLQIKVVAENGHQERYVVQSYVSNRNGPLLGVVQAEVILGNIPIRNGVVHLISKPLTIITNVYKTLKIDESTAEFFKLVSEHASPQLKELLYRPPDLEGITALVPSNFAITSKPEMMESIKSNATLLDEFIRCHLVLGTIWSTQFSNAALSRETTAGNKATIIFNTVEQSGGWRYTVGIAGAENSTIKIDVPDLRAINGVIHMIDGVLECGNV